MTTNREVFWSNPLTGQRVYLPEGWHLMRVLGGELVVCTLEGGALYVGTGHCSASLKAWITQLLNNGFQPREEWHYSPVGEVQAAQVKLQGGKGLVAGFHGGNAISLIMMSQDAETLKIISEHPLVDAFLRSLLPLSRH